MIDWQEKIYIFVNLAKDVEQLPFLRITMDYNVFYTLRGFSVDVVNR